MELKANPSLWLNQLASENFIRRSAMLLLAFFMLHLISYQKLPFTAGYQFPWITYLTFVAYGVVICEINYWNYRKLNIQYPYAANPALRVRKQIITNIGWCLLIFTVLTSLQAVLLNKSFTAATLAGYLSIYLLISAVETSIFIIKELIPLYRKGNPLTLKKLASSTNHDSAYLRVLSGSKLVNIPFEKLSYVFSENGIVITVDINQQTLTTQFSSLSEVEQLLDDRFFRANRQYIISKGVVRSVKSGTNKKLNLELDSAQPKSIIISRYRNPQFKAWFNGTPVV